RAPILASSPPTRTPKAPNPTPQAANSGAWRPAACESNPRCAAGPGVPSARPRQPGPLASRPPPP
uniref:Uncharacterized protein n=1 Tax=Aegilops tauschii subsp. strangulata TaxID=200361 RepID=A0A453NG53_AEGTS